MPSVTSTPRISAASTHGGRAQPMVKKKKEMFWLIAKKTVWSTWFVGRPLECPHAHIEAHVTLMLPPPPRAWDLSCAGCVAPRRPNDRSTSDQYRLVFLLWLGMCASTGWLSRLGTRSLRFRCDRVHIAVIQFKSAASVLGEETLNTSPPPPPPSSCLAKLGVGWRGGAGWAPLAVQCERWMWVGGAP